MKTIPLLLALSLHTAFLHAADWPQFRGPTTIPSSPSGLSSSQQKLSPGPSRAV
jgi:hypothetical protein